MMTRHQISEALAAINAGLVSQISGVSAKTIYRLRQDPEHNASANTLERLTKAINQLKTKGKKQ